MELFPTKGKNPHNFHVILFKSRTNMYVKFELFAGFNFKSLHIQKIILAVALVTQPMMQRPPNPTELGLMESYIRILCR